MSPSRLASTIASVTIISTCVALTLSAVETMRITLPGALALGLERNLDLVKKKLDVEFKRMTAGEAFRAFLPQLSMSFNRAVTTRVHDADSRQYRYELGVDQLVFDGGKTKQAYKLAQADAEIAGKLLAVQERTLRLEILTAFAKVLGGAESVVLYGEFLRTAEKEMELAELEVRLGTTTLVDREEAGTQYESAKLDLVKGQEDYATARIAFGKALRLPAGAEFQLVGRVEDGFATRPLRYSEEALFGFARRERIDFANSALAWKRAVFEYETVRDSWLPDIALSGKFSLSGPDWSPTEKGFSLFLKFSFPLFGSPASGNGAYSGGNEATTSSSLSLNPFQDIGYLRKKAQARAQAHFARLDDAELPEDVRREIRLAVTALDLSRKRGEIRERQLATLRKRIEILELKTKLGETRRLDLAKAKTELYKALLGRVEGIVDYITTAFKLETTAGLLPGTLRLFDSDVFRLQ